MSIQRDKKNVPCPVLGEYPHFGNHCVKGNLAMAISPHTSGQRVCYIQIDVPWLPNTENDSLNEDVLGWWADTDCSSAWFSSIKEANRLLTPTSIPHGFTHTYKPISVTVVNTGLIIASPGQSRVPRVNPITKKIWSQHLPGLNKGTGRSWDVRRWKHTHWRSVIHFCSHRRGSVLFHLWIKVVECYWNSSS